MKQSSLFAVSASSVVFVLSSLLSCKEPAPIGSGSGGQDYSNGGSAGGMSGAAGNDAAASGQGGTVAPATWTLPDVPPAEPDLPQEALAPTGDSNCGSVTQKTKRLPVDVLLVLDRSTSMKLSIADTCYCNSADVSTGAGSLCKDTANCTTRWNAIKNAMKTTLAKSTYVNWGLKYFSSPGEAECGVTKGPPEIPLGETSAADKIQSKIEASDLSTSTPTAAGINTAVDYLKTVDDGNKKFILLATDGEPNCAVSGGKPGVGVSDLAGATAAMTAAKNAEFLAYVIGIGPSLTNLNQLAQAGAGRDYFPATSAEELAKALSSINQMVVSCIFNSETAPPDPKNVAVYVNGQRVNQSDGDGWKYGDSTQSIELTGKFCKDLQSGTETDVQILFGCEGETYFPPDIY